MQCKSKHLRRQFHGREELEREGSTCTPLKFQREPNWTVAIEIIARTFSRRRFLARVSKGLPALPTRMVTAPAQPWMRQTVLNKFGRTMPRVWKAQTNKLNPFRSSLRDDGGPVPIEQRIRFWKLARGDRVAHLAIDQEGVLID